MYKMIIADDEPTELRFLRQVIEKYNLPFYIVGEGENGHQALELALKHRPDFIILDIHMPFMDGLKAAELIKRSLPETKIYILTAYSYFDYARQAIHTGVHDYLLKPIHPQQLVETLKKGIATALRSRLQQARGERIKKQMEKTLVMAKDQIILKLIGGSQLSETERVLLNKSWGTGSFQPLSLGVASIWLTNGHVALYRDVMFELGNKFLKVESPGIFTVTPSGLLVFLWGEKVPVLYTKLAKEITKYMEDFGLNVTLGLAAIPPSGDIAVAFKEADEARSRGVFWHKTGILPTHFINFRRYPLLDIAAISRQLLDIIFKQRDPQAVISYLEQQLKLLEPGYPAPEEVCMLTGELFNCLLSECDIVFSADDIKQLRQKIRAELCDVDTRSRWRERVNALTVSFVQLLEKCSTNSVENQIKWAMQFINQNYYRDISLEGVATKVFLHPCYFSRLFKRFAGEGFSEYVMRVRMEKARYLLMTGKYTIEEVSKQVGFRDSSYFRKVFKRNFGIRPSQVMRSVKEQDIPCQNKKNS